MDFGLFNLMQRRDHAESIPAVYQHASDSVRLAEDIGFEVAWFAEHHFSDYCLCPSPMLGISWCAAQTSRIKLAPGVLVLPLYDPIRLVQEVAMADEFCEGRFLLGTGTGYQSYEFDRFGLDLNEGGDRFLELQDILEMGLAEGEIEYNGHFYQIPHTRLAARSTRGLPDRIIAGVLNHPGIRRRVAEHNYTALLSPGWNPFSMMEQQKTRYQDVFKEVGRDHTKLRLAVMRFVHVTDSPEEALAAAESFRYSTRVAVALRFDYGEFNGTLHHDIPAREEPTLEQMRDNMVIGDAETCAERIVDEINCLEPAHYICYMKGGSLNGDRVLRSLEKFGTHVMPQVEKAIPNLDDIGGNIDQRAKQGLEVTNCLTR